jgi:hypothetical protein
MVMYYFLIIIHNHSYCSIAINAAHRILTTLVWHRTLRDSVVDEVYNLAGDTEEEQARKRLVQAFEADQLTNEEMEEWFKKHPEQWERSFSDFTHGTWFPMAQQWVGPTCSVGGLIFYTDEVIVGKNCMVYPMYGEATTCHELYCYCHK